MPEEPVKLDKTLDAKPYEPTNRSRSLTWLWITLGVFAALLLAFCFGVLQPYMQVDAQLKGWTFKCDPKPRIAALGGPREATRKLRLYVTFAPIFFSDNKHVAITLLSHCGPDGAAALAAMLDSATGTGDAGAYASALAATGSPEAFEGIDRCYAREKRAGVRDHLIRAMGQLDDPRAYDWLVARSSDIDPEIRGTASHGFASRARRGDTRAFESIIAMVGDTDPGVRADVAGALGWTGRPEAFKPLIILLLDKKVVVSNRAIGALPEVPDQRVFGVLIVLLDEKSPDIRRRSAHALGKLGDARALDKLDVLIDKDPDAKVRDTAGLAAKYIRNGKKLVGPMQ